MVDFRIIRIQGVKDSSEMLKNYKEGFQDSRGRVKRRKIGDRFKPVPTGHFGFLITFFGGRYVIPIKGGCYDI